MEPTAGNTDHATPPGAACPRCEESARLAGFEENRRPVRRTARPLRLAASAVLIAYGWAWLTTGRPGLGALLLAGGLAVGALTARAVVRAGSGQRTQVFHCPRCLVRFRPGDPVLVSSLVPRPRTVGAAVRPASGG
ncbi:hypothetical protein ACGFZP_35085 [Kitasatospora sp. NPDC048239]|uniref:hypothetical protein n=1 Tax=Kitasatospora sp. NPDC048239 TaxID=3364046 RepID=UPI003713F197